MLALTTEAALDILIDWLQDNISCDTDIIFDNDEDRTNSASAALDRTGAKRGSRSPSSSATVQNRLAGKLYFERASSTAGALIYIDLCCPDETGE